MTGKKTLHILVDMGSSHSFLNEKLGKVFQDHITKINPMQVTVADGDKVVGMKMVKDFA